MKKSVLKPLLFGFIFSFLAITARGQTLSGVVVDETQRPIDGAVVALLRASDSSLVKTTLSEPDGRFAFLGVKAQTYRLTVSFLGHKNYVGAPLILRGGDTALAPVVLPRLEKVLDAVTVSAKVPFIEKKVDRTVVNVEAQISNAGANALEALEKAPGILVDPNGGIALKGQAGVAVFIDDKPTYLSGEALQNYLRSLPANAIKQIEIMTNPPAKYDAASNGGVINIITKRNTLRGLFGSFAVNYNQGIYARSNNSFNLNYNGKKMAFYANASASLVNIFQDLFINREYLTANLRTDYFFNQNSKIRREGWAYNAKIGVDYYVSSRTTLGFVAKGLANPVRKWVDNVSTIRSDDQALRSTVSADNDDLAGFGNGTLSLNLRHNLDSVGQTLTVDADYAQYTSTSEQVFVNSIFAPNNTFLRREQLNGNLPSNIAIYALKSDYTKPLPGGAKFEAGVKTAFTQTDNTADYRDVVNGVPTINYNLTNRFKYDEWINAAYVNYARSWSKTQIQAGLRLENTTMRGKQLGNGIVQASEFNRDYVSLFPTFYYAYTLDSAGAHQLGFNFGRRIERPFFKDLNPFVSPLDKFTFYSGNPFLRPEFSNKFTLSYSYKGTFVANLNYAYSKDAIYETLEIDSAQVYFSRPNNIGVSQVYNVDVTLNVPLAKRVTANLYVEAGYMAYKSALYTEPLNAGGFYTIVQGNVSFQLKNAWSAELSGQYQSNIVWGQLTLLNFGVLNAGVQKKILKNKGSVKLAVNDALFTRRGSGIINNLRLTKADWNSTLDSRQVALTFSYNFGKASKGKQRYSGSGSESEQQRVRQ